VVSSPYRPESSAHVMHPSRNSLTGCSCLLIDGGFTSSGPAPTQRCKSEALKDIMRQPQQEKPMVIQPAAGGNPAWQAGVSPISGSQRYRGSTVFSSEPSYTLERGLQLKGTAVAALQSCFL
jgi:hypothetical protein